MPKGPEGEKRPAGVIGNAVHVMRLLGDECRSKGKPSPAHADRRRSRCVGLCKGRNHLGLEPLAIGALTLSRGTMSGEQLPQVRDDPLCP